MTITIEGRKYNFEVVVLNEYRDFGFFIRAVCKSTRRVSCINNLNAVLSEFNIGVDYPRGEDSTWIVTENEVDYLVDTAREFLSDSATRNYIERQLDEDRMLGEWENKVSKYRLCKTLKLPPYSRILRSS